MSSLQLKVRQLTTKTHRQNCRHPLQGCLGNSLSQYPGQQGSSSALRRLLDRYIYLQAYALAVCDISSRHGRSKRICKRTQRQADLTFMEASMRSATRAKHWPNHGANPGGINEQSDTFSASFMEYREGAYHSACKQCQPRHSRPTETAKIPLLQRHVHP